MKIPSPRKLTDYGAVRHTPLYFHAEGHEGDQSEKMSTPSVDSTEDSTEKSPEDGHFHGKEFHANHVSENALKEAEEQNNDAQMAEKNIDTIEPF